MAIRVGDPAYVFTLKDQNNQDFDLEQFKEKKVLLSFHPLAWTAVCAEQMLSLEKNKDTFERLNTVAVGISVDPVPTKVAWAKNLGISHTPLLSDFWPHGQVASRMDIFREKDGVSQRANIILDDRHQVLWVKTYPMGELPDIQEVIDFLEGS